MAPALTLTIRPATRRDIAEIDALLARSYPALLKTAYSPSVMVTAVPLLARANPRLIETGTYYVAMDTGGRIVGAGGWTSSRWRGWAEIRHLVADRRHVRHGVGGSLMQRIFAEANGVGRRRFFCLATLNAVPFYRKMGFDDAGPVAIPLRPGITFPAMRMLR